MEDKERDRIPRGDVLACRPMQSKEHELRTAYTVCRAHHTPSTSHTQSSELELYFIHNPAIVQPSNRARMVQGAD